MEENKIRSSEPSNPEYATTDLREYLTEVAEAIRVKTGKEDLIPAQNFVEEILEIETETDTSDATAAAEDILSGKTAYANGEKITGTIETVEVTEPTIDFNPLTGLITTTVAQPKGFTNGRIVGAQKQLAFQSAKTITPTAADQVAVSSGQFVGGDITIKGDSNLVADNIVSGKSIFGVVGTATAGGGGDTSVEDSLVTRTVTAYTNNRVTSIGNYAFYYWSSLTSVSFPACTSIGSYAFYSCPKLTSVNFPACTSIGSYAFYDCSSLTSVSFPACTTISNSAFNYCSSLTSVSFPACKTIGSYAFSYCSKLTSVSFPACKTIGSYAFNYCSSLTSVSFPACKTIGKGAFNGCSRLTSIYLMASSLCTLINSNAFSNAGIWSTKGSIFVPSSLVASYKAATNWAFFSNRIFGI